MSDITEKLEENLLSRLLCILCKSYLSVAPILINQQGENVCGRCASNLTTESNLFTHNTFYENVACSFQFPCKYSQEGCSVKQYFNEIEDHENKCPFRICKCQVKTCKWSGNAVEEIIHYTTHHKSYVLKHNVPRSVIKGQRSFLVKAHGYHFLLEWNCTEFGVQLKAESLDIPILSDDIKFVCRMFSQNFNDLSLAIDSFGLNSNKNLSFLSLCTQKLPISSMSFTIHVLLPEELIVKKSEDLKKIECNQCTKIMVPPILTCGHGHILCVDCTGLDNNFCAECQEEHITYTHAPKLELIAVCSLYTCRWSGCDAQFSYKKIRAHEQSCVYRVYTCLYCYEWQGFHDELIDHDNLCHSKFIYCPMSLKTQVTVLGIRTGKLKYSFLVYREIFVVSFVLNNTSADITIVNFGPSSLLNWYRFEADMTHIMDSGFAHNRTYEFIRTFKNRYNLSISCDEIAPFGGNEFYKLTVKILKNDNYLQ